MKHSRRVSVGLLTLAAAALGVDKLILQGEPSGASAAMIVATPTIESRTTRAEEMLSEVLAALAGEVSAIELDGAFAVPSSWRGDVAAEAAAPAAVLPRLLLSSTSTQAAVINGVAVRVGAALDEGGLVRLVSVDGESASAIVEFSGVRYRLEVGSEDAREVGLAGDSAGRAGSAGANGESGR